MRPDNSLLHYFVRDSLRIYSEDFKILNKQNPIAVRLNGRKYSIHISYVHGAGNTRPEYEARIQLSGNLIDAQNQRSGDEHQAVVIGLFEGGRVFVAWDPHHALSRGTPKQVSLYARWAQEATVEEHLAAVYEFTSQQLDGPSFAIALPAHALGFYMENIVKFHDLNSEEDIQRLINDHAEVLDENAMGSNSIAEDQQDETRERFSYTRTAYRRDPLFKKLVLGAYGSACCVCGRQLAIVQAAHIIPHSEPDCPNSVNNGLAMCIEHHRLYDDALLLPGPDRQMMFNEERARYLQQINQQRGLDEIAGHDGREFNIPDNSELRPSEDYLQRGLDVRLGH